MVDSSPLDPRELHGYEDAPRHTFLIWMGAVVAAVLLIPALGALFIGAAPSAPCQPGSECGPEPLSFLLAGGVLLGLAVASVIWSIAWDVRDGRYRFHVPPDWPSPPPTWQPPRGWSPSPSWPPPPTDWKYWR